MRQSGGDMGQSVCSRTTQHECCLLQSATEGQSEPNIHEEFDAYLHQLGSFDAYLCPSGRFMSQMTKTPALWGFLRVGAPCPQAGGGGAGGAQGGPGHIRPRHPIDLRYGSKSWLWWQALAGITVVQSHNALRRNARHTADDHVRNIPFS